MVLIIFYFLFFLLRGEIIGNNVKFNFGLRFQRFGIFRCLEFGTLANPGLRFFHGLILLESTGIWGQMIEAWLFLRLLNLQNVIWVGILLILWLRWQLMEDVFLKLDSLEFLGLMAARTRLGTFIGTSAFRSGGGLFGCFVFLLFFRERLHWSDFLRIWLWKIGFLLRTREKLIQLFVQPFIDQVYSLNVFSLGFFGR